MQTMRWWTVRLVAASIVTALGGAGNGLHAQIPIAPIERQSPVDFEREILPILRQKCLACHSTAEKQGSLVLESPATMRKGGDSGPAVVAGKSGESLLLKLASHAQEPFMPPPKNEVAAQPLTSQELGLLRLWIDQGAQGGPGVVLSPRQWHPLPPGVNPIQAVALTADGQYAACTRANQIFVYHVPTGALVTRLTDPTLQPRDGDPRPGVAHWDLVQSLAFNADGDLLASGSFREVKLWRRPRDVRAVRLAAGGPVTAVAASPDGRWLATSGKDHAIHIWQADNGALLRSLAGHTDRVTRLRFLPEGKRLVSVSQDQTLRVWDVSSGACVGRIDTPVPLTSVAVTGILPVNPNDTFLSGENTRWLATGGGDNLVRLWAVPDALPERWDKVPADAERVAVSADGKLAGFALASGRLLVVDVATRAPVADWANPLGPALAMTFLPPRSDGNPPPLPRLVTAQADGTICVWNATNGQKIDQLQGQWAPARSVAATPDGSGLAAGYENGGCVYWKWPAEEPRTLEPLNVPSWDALAVGPSGNWLAVAGNVDGKPVIVVQDLAANRIVARLTGPEATVRSLAFSQDESKLAAGSDDKTARVWNLRDGNFPEIARLAEHPREVTAVALSQDGNQLLSGCADLKTRLWNLADGMLVREFAPHGAPISCVAFGPGNQPISASLDHTVRFWNPADGQQQRAIQDPAGIVFMTFSNDGQRLAVAADDKHVRVYDTANGQLRWTLAGHVDVVQDVRFARDGSRLMTTVPKQQVGLWDMQNGQLLDLQTRPDVVWASLGTDNDQWQWLSSSGQVHRQPLRFRRTLAGMTAAIVGLAFQADGQQLYAAGADGALRGFRLNDGQTIWATSHGAPIHDLAISPNGQYLATAGDNGQVRTWNASNGSPLPQAPNPMLPGPVRAVTFSSDNTRLIAAHSGDQRQIVWYDVATGGLWERQREPRHDVTDLVAFGAGRGHVVAVVPGESAVQFTSHAVRAIAGHGQPVTAIVSIPATPTEILSGSLDGTLRRWDVLNGQQRQQFNHGGPVTDVAVRPDGLRFASTSSNHTAKLWNAQNGQQIAEMRGDVRLRNEVLRLTQQQTAATARQTAAKQRAEAAEKDLPVKMEADKKAAEALAAANQEVQTKTAMVKTTMEAKVAQEKLAVELAAKAQQAAVAKQQADRLAMEMTMLAQRLTERSNRLAALAQSAPNDPNLAKAAADAKAQAADAQAKAQQATAAQAAPAKALEEATRAANEAAAKIAEVQKPYNEALAALKTAEAAQNLAAQTRAIAARELQQAQEELPAAKTQLAGAETALQQVQEQLKAAQQRAAEAEQPIVAADFSPDGRLLVTAGDFPNVHSWDGETGVAMAAFAGSVAPLKSVVFVSNEYLLSGAEDGAADLWEVNPGWRLERTLGGIDKDDLFSHRVTALDFSRDGKLLAVGSGTPSRKGPIHVFDVATGQLKWTVPDAHDDTVFGVQFSPDGKRLASVGADKYLRTFDAESGALLRRFEGHTNYVLAVCWKSDGQLVATAGADKTVKIWNPDTGDQLRTIEGFQKTVTAVRFIGDTENIVSSCGDGTLRMHNANNGGNFRNFGGAGYAQGVAITPNGDTLIAGGHDSNLRIWNGNNGQLLRTLEPPKDSDPAAGSAVAP